MSKVLDNGVLRDATPEEQADIDARADAPPIIPQQVTMRQARLALLGAGLLAGVETAINGLPSPQKEAARIEWDYSSMVERERSLVLTLGGALGLTSGQLDTLFVTAAGL